MPMLRPPKPMLVTLAYDAGRLLSAGKVRAGLMPPPRRVSRRSRRRRGERRAEGDMMRRTIGPLTSAAAIAIALSTTVDAQRARGRGDASAGKGAENATIAGL